MYSNIIMTTSLFPSIYVALLLFVQKVIKSVWCCWKMCLRQQCSNGQHVDKVTYQGLCCLQSSVHASNLYAPAIQFSDSRFLLEVSMIVAPEPGFPLLVRRHWIEAD